MQNAKKAILQMLCGFPQTADIDGYVAALLTACVGCDERDVVKAASMFVIGAVDNHNPRFAPSSAEFRKEVGAWVRHRRELETAKLPSPTATDPNWKPPTEEEKRRVSELLGRVKASLAQASLDDKLRQKAMRDPQFYSYAAHVEDYRGRQALLECMNSRRAS